jgi:hypothetical protein
MSFFSASQFVILVATGSVAPNTHVLKDIDFSLRNIYLERKKELTTVNSTKKVLMLQFALIMK